MKITFEGQSIHEIVDQMKHVIAAYPGRGNPSKPGPTVEAPKSMPDFVFEAPAGDKPTEKRVRTEKQLANDEKLRERAQAKKAAGLKPFDKTPKAPVEKQVAKPPIVAKAVEKPVENPVEEPAVFADPAEVVRIRQKTIVDLQEAYANGHQQEVFELLSRFGNGAKSFRELPPESFVPIREAIDKGALT